MSESELDIRFRLLDSSTLGEARQLLKDLNKELNKVAVNNIPLQKELGKQIVEVKNTIASATASTITAKGKEREAYFELGTEMRKWFIQQRAGDRVMREMGQTTAMLGNMLGQGGLSSVVSTAQGAFQQMQFAVVAAGKSMEATQGTLASFGTQLVSVAGGIAGLVAVIALAVMAMQKWKELQEAFNVAIEKNTKAATDYSLITKQQSLDLIEKQIKFNRAKEVEPNYWLAALGPQAAYLDYSTRIVDKATEEINLLIEKEKREKALNDERKKEMIRAEEEGYIEREGFLAVQADLKEEAAYLRIIAEWKEQIQRHDERRLAATLSKRGIEGETVLGKMNVQGLATAEGVSKEPVFVQQISAAQRATDQLGESMQSSFQEATSYLAEGFAQAFGLGNSLLDRMISTFATSALMALPGLIASMLTAGATGNIFTALGAMIFDSGGTINEPVSGVGLRSGRQYRLAWNGQPEQVTPVNSVGQSARYSGGMQPSVTVVPIESNAGLAVRVEVGNRINRKRRL